MLVCRTIGVTKAFDYFTKGFDLCKTSRWWGKGAELNSLDGPITNEVVFARILKGYSSGGRKKLAAKRVKLDKRRAAIDCVFSAPKPPDPHLHTHCLIMNMTKLPSGAWYSHLNEAIYRDRVFLGMVYQHHLACELQQLGYSVFSKGKGQFELKGFEQKSLKAFSKRRQKILESSGYGTAKERDLAWRVTRAWKKEICPLSLQQHWRLEAKTLGISFIEPGVFLIPVSHPKLDIDHKLLDKAIAHASERTISFLQKDLEQFVLDQGIPVDPSLISKAINSHPRLIRLSATATDEIRYTTKSALNRELDTVDLMKRGLKSQKPIYKGLSGEDFSNSELTDTQKIAIATCLTTTDQFIAIETIKTLKLDTLRGFKDLAQKAGFQVKAFAPTAEAAKVLGDEVGCDANTVASLLCSKPPNKIEAKQIWVVDEAGLLGASAVQDLLQRASAQKARVLFVEDIRRLFSLNVGNPLKSLQREGMPTVKVTLSLKKSPHIQKASELMALGEIKKSFAVLEESGSIQQAQHCDKITQITEDYLAIASDERDKTVIVVQTKDEVEDITVRIRSRLIEGGQLGKSARITQLKAKTIKGAQCRDINNIEIGDGIKPTKDYKKRNLKKARLYTVLDKTRDRLTLVDKEGTKYTVDPIFEKTVYTQIPLQIAEGDRLFWTRRDSQLQHKKGQEFKVKWIRENTAKIEYYDGKIEQINLNTPLHLDFGWVKPNYRSRGNDEKILMFVGALDKDNFYKALSGTKYQLKFYMDNVQEFLEVVSLEQENPLADKREELAAQRRETNFKEKIIKNSVVKVYNETRDLIKLSDSSQEIVKDTDSKKEKNTIETQSNKPEKSKLQLNRTQTIIKQNSVDLTYLERLNKYQSFLDKSSKELENPEKTKNSSQRKPNSETEIER